jgi:gliding motility-associated-like protein
MFGVMAANGQGFYNTTNWRFSNPKQFGFTVFDVDFFDNSNVIAVGNDGGIAKSSDGGVNWTYGPFTYVNAAGLITKSTLNDVHYITATVAYAVGSAGCMAKTTDGGATWTFVNNPLYGNSRNINTCWFIDQNRGYIGGQWNSVDSIPKVYFTNNGGATWDSLVSPIGGKTRVGYINNPNLPPQIWDVTGKGKEIQRIEFTSPNVGYVIGGGQVHFPPLPAANASTCLPNGLNTSTSANNAALVWKFNNGVLTDYSISKERLGFTGIVTNTITCTSAFNAAQYGPVINTYRAMNIINDSLIVIMSFNNNNVMRINTGRLDSTRNNVTGLNEQGRYEIMNMANRPFQGPDAGPTIPAVQVLLASNPNHIKRASNGKLYAPSFSSAFDPRNRVWTSVDTGRNWIEETNLPTGRVYSNMTTIAMDIAPNGKFLTLGVNGVIGDSMPGGTWNSNYATYALGASHSDAAFVDCNNGILAGGASISVTEDGGNTWQNKARADFANSNYTIGGLAYPSLTKAYFAVSNGVIYVSPDKGTTLDPSFSDFNFRMNDVKAVGNDTVYAVGYSQFSVPTANRKSTFFRSFNGGLSWQAIDIVANTTTPAFTAPTLSKLAFPSRNIGYAAGSRNGVYKTTDAGTTWTRINPFPSLNEGPVGFTSAFVTYQEIVAVDDNTVIVIGNMFTNTGVKRVYKTVDGGANWTDITGNLSALFPVGNLIGLVMHDANNGYVTAGSALFKTTNGGTSWTMDIAPTNSLFETMTFAPSKVVSTVQMQNRKLFVTGAGVPQGNASIMEYGNLADLNVRSTEVATDATCTNPSGGTITITATGGIAPYTYSIDGGAFQSSNVFTGLTQGTKTIVIRDAYCGRITKTVTIGFTDNLTLTVNPVTAEQCAGGQIQLQATSATGATYAWTPATGLSAANIANPVATVNNAIVYTVRATLGTCTRTATSTINLKPNPIVNAGPDKTILVGDAVTLNGVGPNGTQSIAWTPVTGILSGANSYTPSVAPTTTTTYTLIVRDFNGCTATDNAVVTVLSYCIKPMEAFTPNGDGINDLWLVTAGSQCATKISANVFNRYGNRVFESNNYQNNWNGTYDGKPLPDGTYYFIVRYTLINGTVVEQKGNVTILR